MPLEHLAAAIELATSVNALKTRCPCGLDAACPIPRSKLAFHTFFTTISYRWCQGEVTWEGIMAVRRLMGTFGLVGIISLAGCRGGAGVGSNDYAVPAAMPGGTSAIPSLGQRLAKTSQDDLFIADDHSNVLIYTADINQPNPPLLGQITQGVSRSTGVYVDRHGTLYVLNNGGSSTNITEYKRGSSTPFETIEKGLAYRNPKSLAVDRSDNLYVAEDSPDGTQVEVRVVVYAAGATSPTRYIALPTQSGFRGANMTFDPKGDLLVDTFDDESNTTSVYRVARGSSEAKKLNLQDPPGPSLGSDKAGYIYVGDEEGSIAIYPPGGTSASRIISLNVDGFYSQMAVTPNGTIYWPNYDNETMYEIAPEASGATNVFSTAGSGVDAAVGRW
jgi:hypothetical protein